MNPIFPMHVSSNSSVSNYPRLKKWDLIYIDRNTIFDKQGPLSIETLVAEKFDAIVKFGEANGQ